MLPAKTPPEASKFNALLNNLSLLLLWTGQILGHLGNRFYLKASRSIGFMGMEIAPVMC
ncbi:hypothetical protein Cha6605_4511 [Chamaesiphon minutus PCC 6605]|uniref:Uncharacterized protein n=1 Tax=Chamaesiphon minutus (strain ATCC 27169 / PCC 6605) TaxID=1173020 RepID=K9UML9_CHAP6|nr:hypothetical protein Cha6605_4511 [Chamaesiphon minutus PCC 6605]